MHHAFVSRPLLLGGLLLVPACDRGASEVEAPGELGSPPSGATPSADPGTASGPSVDPAARFAAAEAELDAPVARAGTCQLTATGTVQAELTAALQLGEGESVQLSVAGDFAGRAVAAALDANAETIELSVDGAQSTVDSPGQVRDAITVGLMRMGLLHNAAMLIGGQGPDHADGTVRDWVKTKDHRYIEVDGERVVQFDLVVAGGVPSTADLSFDTAGLPHVRHQTVDFAEGTMHVTEVCTWR